MAALAWVFLGLLAGLLVGVLVGRRWWGAGRTAKGAAVAAPGGLRLLSDQSLEWLRRSHGALGVWALEAEGSAPAPGASGLRSLADPGSLSPERAETVAFRLEQVRRQTQGGVERLEFGSLLYETAEGAVAAMLLPAGAPTLAIERAREDAIVLLDGLARHGALQRGPEGESRRQESVASIGLRLAYQVERLLEGEAAVAVAGPSGVRIVGVSGRGDPRLMRADIDPDSTIARVATGAPAPPDGVEDPLRAEVGDRRHPSGRCRLLPVMSGPRPVGAVAVWLPGRSAPEAALAAVREAIRAAGPRLEDAVAYQERELEAASDPLTGLANRRGLDATMSRFGGERGTLVCVDLDRFKLLNDTLGHAAGDAALVHVARILREHVRHGDVAARVGGEEFALWLPLARLEEGVRVAVRVRERLVGSRWRWQDRAWPLTASFGVSSCPETTRDHKNLLAQADAALYAAKGAGRDRVEVAERVPG